MQTGSQAVPGNGKGRAHRHTDVLCPSNLIQEERSWRNLSKYLSSQIQCYYYIILLGFYGTVNIKGSDIK